MRIVIVGYGTQGKKRHKIAKRNIVAIVDPNINLGNTPIRMVKITSGIQAANSYASAS